MKLKELRKNFGYTQKEIAKILETSEQVYCRWEKEIHQIPLQHLWTLANLYKVDMNELIGFEDNKKNINEERLLVAFRKMDPANQNSLITFAEYSVSQQQKLDQNKQVK